VLLAERFNISQGSVPTRFIYDSSFDSTTADLLLKLTQKNFEHRSTFRDVTGKRVATLFGLTLANILVVLRRSVNACFKCNLAGLDHLLDDLDQLDPFS